jgi:hypothetical protein
MIEHRVDAAPCGGTHGESGLIREIRVNAKASVFGAAAMFTDGSRVPETGGARRW